MDSGKLVAGQRRVRFPVPLTETAVYPGFPTDLQSPLMAVFATIPERAAYRNLFLKTVSK